MVSYDSNIIALDIDGVITNIYRAIKEAAPNAELERVSNVLLTPEGDESLNYHFEDPDFWYELTPIKDSWHQINEWYCDGYEIHFITARRNPYARECIGDWLDRWKVQYDEFHICDMLHKVDVINDLNPLIFVDDNPYEIAEVKKEIKNNFTMPIAMHTVYNKHAISELEKTDGIDSVISLSDIKLLNALKH